MYVVQCQAFCGQRQSQLSLLRSQCQTISRVTRRGKSQMNTKKKAKTKY